MRYRNLLIRFIDRGGERKRLRQLCLAQSLPPHVAAGHRARARRHQTNLPATNQ